VNTYDREYEEEYAKLTVIKAFLFSFLNVLVCLDERLLHFDTFNHFSNMTNNLHIKCSEKRWRSGVTHAVTEGRAV
jgi:hypothetical protein